MYILQRFTIFTSGILLVLIISSIVIIFTSNLLQEELPPILYGSDETLRLYDPSCGDLLVVCSDRDRLLISGLHTYAVGQWSPDGKTIAVHLLDGWMLYPADCLLSGQNCQPHYLTPQPDDFRIAWGPDGSAIALMSNEGSELVIRSRGCWEGVQSTCVEQDTMLMNPGQIVQSGLVQPAWSADGSRFAFISVNNTLHTMDARCLNAPETCRFALKTLPVERSLTFWPSLSGDGRSVLYFAIVPGQTVTEVYMRDVESGAGERLSLPGQSTVVPDWTPDGRFVLFSVFNRQGAEGNWNVMTLDRARGLHVLVTRGSSRDMYASWGQRK